MLLYKKFHCFTMRSKVRASNGGGWGERRDRHFPSTCCAVSYEWKKCTMSFYIQQQELLYSAFVYVLKCVSFWQLLHRIRRRSNWMRSCNYEFHFRCFVWWLSKYTRGGLLPSCCSQMTNTKYKKKKGWRHETEDSPNSCVQVNGQTHRKG